MAWSFFKWLRGETDAEDEKPVKEVTVKDFLDETVGTAADGLAVYISRMAFWAIVRKIGAAVAAAEWKTYRRGKEEKGREYWAWNFAPNPNQTRQEFFRELVGQLYQAQEALVVEAPDGSRYVADAFSKEESLGGDIYRDITVRGESLGGVFRASDVLHISVEGERMDMVLAAVSGAEGKLMRSAYNAYLRSQGTHGVLNIGDLAEADPDFDETYSGLVNEWFKKYFTAENAVLPLFQGYTYTEMESKGGSTKSSLSGTRDIRNLIDDIVALTAQALGVPASVVTGKGVTEADFKSFMTHTVQPLVGTIATEINRKVYGRANVLNRTYVCPDLAAVKYTDLFDVANPIDKLIGSGAFCINDIRQRLGLGVIDAPWAWQHWMTKNYSSVEDLLVGVDDNPAGQPEEEARNEEEDE